MVHLWKFYCHMKSQMLQPRLWNNVKKARTKACEVDSCDPPWVERWFQNILVYPGASLGSLGCTGIRNKWCKALSSISFFQVALRAKIPGSHFFSVSRHHFAIFLFHYFWDPWSYQMVHLWKFYCHMKSQMLLPRLWNNVKKARTKACEVTRRAYSCITSKSNSDAVAG